MTRLVTAAGFATMATAAMAAVMPLEWNSSYDTSVPYELELSPAKLESLGGVKQGTGFRVKAATASGEKTLSVTTFKGRQPCDIGLRFLVPMGTKALSLEAGVDTRNDVDGMEIDNLLSGGMEVAAWRVPDGAKATTAENGILFETKGMTTEHLAFDAVVPETLCGKPAKFELDIESLTSMTWGGFCRVMQFDAAGVELPEDVVDPRWISHMRPKGVKTEYRERGRFHPQAARMRIDIELRSVSFAVDAYGMPRTDPDQSRARLLMSHIALRGAACLPFPKYDDSYFAEGASGGADDFALRLCGSDRRAFFYATHSQACWAQGKDLRDESLNFYPEGAGTVEAWFRPDWTAFAKRSGGNPCRLFSVNHGYMAASFSYGRGVVMELAYNPNNGRLSLDMQDWRGHKFSGTGEVEIPGGIWTHVAVQFEPGGVAEVFVGGRKVFEVALDGYEAFNLKDESVKYPNDQSHMEFYLGSCHKGAREPSGDKNTHPLFEGAADLLRVSSGRRYAECFKPCRALSVDDETRALFTFDRTFDGVSGGGIGFVRGTTRSIGAGRIGRRLTIDGKQVQYFPPEIDEKADPRKVLEICNYPDVPMADDFAAAWMRKRKTVKMRIGDTMRILAPEKSVTDCIEIANKGDKPLLYPVLLGDGDLDVRSLGDAADSLATSGLSDADRANRLFQFVIGASDYFMNKTIAFYPGRDTARFAPDIAMQVLNAYCGFECGPLNNLTANLFACAGGIPASQTGGYGHSFEQVFYDGKNHIYDLSSQSFFPAMDNETAVSLDESEDETGAYHRIGKSPEMFVRRSTRSFSAQTPGYQEKMGFVLNPGERLRVWFANNGEMNDIQFIPDAIFNPQNKKAYSEWESKFPNMPWYQDYTERVHGDPKGKKMYRVNRFFPDFASAFVAYDGKPSASNPAFGNVAADSFCYRVKSTYPIVWARYEATLIDGTAADLEISTDRGKSFRPLPHGDLRYEVRARNEYLVRIKASMANVGKFSAKTEVMVNRRTFPGKIRAGENILRLCAASESEAEVSYVWREPKGRIDVADAPCSGTIRGFERQLAVVEPGKPCTLSVCGVSDKAEARAGNGLEASMKGGRLTIRATAKANAKPFFSTVTIADGERFKRITVLVCKGARLALADKATLSGGAALAAPDKSCSQPRVLLKSRNDSADFKFDGIPAGRYMVYQLERFEGGNTSFNRNSCPLAFRDPSADGALTSCGGPNTIQHDYLKAPTGRTGGRGAFKWDAAPDIRHKFQVAWLSRRFDFPVIDHLEYTLSQEIPRGVEVSAVLVVPDPDEDFYCELEKILCGMNCDPWMVK